MISKSDHEQITMTLIFLAQWIYINHTNQDNRFLMKIKLTKILVIKVSQRWWNEPSKIIVKQIQANEALHIAKLFWNCPLNVIFVKFSDWEDNRK